MARAVRETHVWYVSSRYFGHRLTLDPVVHARPLARLALDNTSCWCFDWANSDTIAVGCTNGLSSLDRHHLHLMPFPGSIVVVKVTAALAQRKPNEIAGPQSVRARPRASNVICDRTLSNSLLLGTPVGRSKHCMAQTSADASRSACHRRRSHNPCVWRARWPGLHCRHPRSATSAFESKQRLVLLL